MITLLLPFWEARNVKKSGSEARMMSSRKDVFSKCATYLNNFLSVFPYFP
ncbi:hypothetical protein Bca4012_026299 [Brassica carinata]